MKNEKGITIISLIVYIILLTFAIAGMSAITSSFYSNINQVEADSKGAVAFAKINMVLLNDIKADNVELVIDDTSSTKMTLSVNGEEIVYRIQNDSLYRQNVTNKENVKICDKVKSASFVAIKGDTKSTITLNMTINNVKRRTNYVIEPKIS